MRKVKKKNNAGFTMVEMIVSFALLSLFLAAASMCISHAFLFFCSEKQAMSSYSVADIVMSELRNEIRTMQGSVQGDKDANGYVKLRGADGKAVTAAGADGVYTGVGLEFVISSLSNDATAVQIDTAGCDNVAMIDDEGVVRTIQSGATPSETEAPSLEADYLTMRYYRHFGKDRTVDLLKEKFMDQVVDQTLTYHLPGFNGVASGRKVVWHAEERLPVKMYQGYTIELQFSVKPRSDGSGHQVADYVDAAVYVKDGGSVVCQKERRIDLQNTVYFKTDKTMYSEVAE